MSRRSFSEEEMRQREKEARSLRRKQEQAYREAQRGVHDWLPPDDGPEEDLLWGDPRDRLYDRVEEDEWEAERRQIREELWDDPWPKAPPRRREPEQEPAEEAWDEPTSRWEEGPWEEAQSPGGQPPWEPEPWEDPAPRPQEELWDNPWPTGGQERPAAPLNEPRTPPRRSNRPPAAPLPSGRKPANRDGSGRPPRKSKKRKVLLIVLIVLLAILAAGVILHQIYVRPPDIPEQQSAGTDPGSMGAGRKDGVYTFLLVGRDDGGGGNTDTIMVGCFDVNNKTLDVLSIYRDTYVDVPWEIAKINSVYNRQGIEGLQQQVKNLIGYTPDFYFVLELDAVSELVDAIGGVDYDVPYSMHYDDPSQDLHIHFEAGMQHIDGDDAVKILRWRKNNSGESLSVGDVGRVEIQHSFLRAVAKEMLSIGTLTKIGDIVDIMNRNLDSNLNYGEMIWFGEQALGLGENSIRFHNLPGDYTGTVWSPTYQNYQSYVFVNSAALRELVNQYMNPYLTDITADMQHVVHDTTVNNLPVETDTAGTADGEGTEEGSTD